MHNTIPEDRIYLDDAVRHQDIVEKRFRERDMVGDLAEMKTFHPGRTGKPYAVVRLVVLCDECRKPYVYAQTNRAMAVYFRQFDFDRDARCKCDKNKGW